MGRPPPERVAEAIHLGEASSVSAHRPDRPPGPRSFRVRAGWAQLRWLEARRRAMADPVNEPFALEMINRSRVSIIAAERAEPALGLAPHRPRPSVAGRDP